MSTSLERELRRLKEAVEILTGERGAAGRPERAVRLREVGSLTAGGGQAITKISQLENDKGYVTAAGAAAAAPIQSIQAGSNIIIDTTDPRNPVISATGGAGGGGVDSVNGQTGDVVLDGIQFFVGPGLPTGGTYANGDRAFDENTGLLYTWVNGAWLATGGGGPAQADVIEIYDDFIAVPPSNTTYGSVLSRSTSNSVVEQSNSLPGNPGIVMLAPSGSSAAQSNIYSISSPFLLGGGEILFEALVWIDYEIGPSVGHNFRVGLWNTDIGNADWGIRFTLLTASAKTIGWRAELIESGSVIEFANEGVAVTVGKQYRLSFIVSADGSSVEAFIDGESIGSTSISSPGSYGAMKVRAQIWSPTGNTNSTSHRSYVDLLRARKTLSTPR